MATTLEDIHRKIIRETPIEQRLEGLTADEILKVVPLEKILKGISLEKIEQFMRKTKKPTKRKKPGEPK